MNRTKIEWTDYTWNPITGCKNGCWYCYGRKLFKRFHKSFEPTFYPERLNELAKLRKPSKIFCCSVADLFADWTKPKWRDAVLSELSKYPQHTFQLLTKQPQNIRMKALKNVWVGATITCDDEMGNLYDLVDNYRGLKFLSFEPLLSFIEFLELDNLYLDQIDWIIIGRLTGSKKVSFNRDAVRHIIREARARDIPIFIKDNVEWEEKIREFPREVI